MSPRSDEFAKDWVASLTMGAGQFCTNPGVAVMIDAANADTFIRQARVALEAVAGQTMLMATIAHACRCGSVLIADSVGGTTVADHGNRRAHSVSLYAGNHVRCRASTQ